MDFKNFSQRTREKRINFSLFRSADLLEKNFKLPGENETVRLISPAGGWSSCSLVLAISHMCSIRSITASTLRVGKKELIALCGIGCRIHFILSGLSRENGSSGKDYLYHEIFEQVCEQKGFTYTYARNHSKVILLDTDIGPIAIETSSNLNENPKIEQFIITQSTEVYSFYINAFAQLGLLGGDCHR